MNKEKFSFGMSLVAIVIALGALFSGPIGMKAGAIAPSDGDATNLTAVTVSRGLAVGSASQFQVDSSGNIAVAGTGTTSLSLTSSSATKGACIPFNATSSATLLNLTFAASTTAVTTAGVAPIIRFGACL